MSPYTPRERFDRSLRNLVDEVLLLGSLAEQAVMDSVEALVQGELDISRRIILEDQKINEKRYEIETNALILIATQQPMARDLRFLAAILEIITELERIADYSKGISKINLMIGPQSTVRVVPEIRRMAELGIEMLHRALTAFTTLDADTARQIPLEDDLVDQLYQQVFQTKLEIIKANPDSIAQANYLIWAAHNLERLADRVTNICERIVFAATGEMMELDHASGFQNDIEYTHQVL